MGEKAVLARAQRGETDAFEELVRCYEKRVYAVALRSTGSPEDAADITQEVFLRAWRSLDSFRGDSGFSTWLFRIAMNLCVDLARRKSGAPVLQPLAEEDEDGYSVPDPAPTPERRLENQELRFELAEAMAGMNEDHRKIILLRDVLGLSYTEIAETLDISEGTVKSRLSRARLALRTILLRRGNLWHVASSKQMEGGEDA